MSQMSEEEKSQALQTLNTLLQKSQNQNVNKDTVVAEPPDSSQTVLPLTSNVSSKELVSDIVSGDRSESGDNPKHLSNDDIGSGVCKKDTDKKYTVAAIRKNLRWKQNKSSPKHTDPKVKKDVTETKRENNRKREKKTNVDDERACEEQIVEDSASTSSVQTRTRRGRNVVIESATVISPVVVKNDHDYGMQTNIKSEKTDERHEPLNKRKRGRPPKTVAIKVIKVPIVNTS